MGFILRLFGADTMERSNPLHPWWYDEVGAVPSAGVNISKSNALQISTVYACDRLISGTLATLPLLVYRRRSDGHGKERDPLHPLSRLLHSRPNVSQTAWQWKRMMQSWLLLRGIAVSRLVLGPSGAVEQLVPIHPDSIVETSKTREGRLRFRVREPGGQEQVLLQDDVFGLMLSLDGVKPLSVIGLAREGFALAKAMEIFGARFFGSGAHPSGVLTHPNTLGEETRKALEVSWNRQHGGLHHSSEAIVLEEGMKWQPMGISNEDSQFLESRKFQREEIATWFGVPQHKVGILDRATFSNIEHQGIEFVQDCMLPWLTLWEQCILRDLVIDPEVHFAEFLVQGLLRGDTATRFASYALAITNGWMTRNEVRELENLNPLQGLDVVLTPLNMAWAPGPSDPEPQPPPADDQPPPTRRRKKPPAPPEDDAPEGGAAAGARKP